MNETSASTTSSGCAHAEITLLIGRLPLPLYLYKTQTFAVFVRERERERDLGRMLPQQSWCDLIKVEGTSAGAGSGAGRASS